MIDIKKLNDLLKELFEMEPLTTFEEPKAEPDHEMKYGLARIYSERGARLYIENQIRVQMKDLSLRAENEKDIFFAKGRILTLKELLVKGKESFEQVQKLNALKNAATE